MAPADDYETLVADICRQLAMGRDVSVRTSATLVGTSRQLHEIDVVAEFNELGVHFLVLIECKHWNKRVGMEQIMVLAERVRDLGAQKGIMVTRIGYQEGAIRIAEANGIALVVCAAKPHVADDDDDYDNDVELDFVLGRTAASHGWGMPIDDVIGNIYEENLSYHVMTQTGLTRTAFPLLLDETKAKLRTS